MDRLRIFISSPGHVDEERRRTAIVIQRIRREFARFFDVSAILWEYDPMLSSGHFQDVIEKPSNTDIVVLILWSRLGTPLPTDRYRGIDGRTPVTGTEWEFEDALASKRDRGTPDLLVYRKMSPPQAIFVDPAGLERAQQQWDALQDFWLRHFVEKDGTFKAAFNHFNALDEYEQQLETHLRALLHERVSRLLRSAGMRPISWHSGSPFRGLLVFDAEHATIFFGRETAEQELVEIFARRAAAGLAFVTVFGASGSGKSSLLRAGVLPTIESPGVVAGVVRWRKLIVTPTQLGADLFDGLAVAMLESEVLPEASLMGDAFYWGRQYRDRPVDAANGIRDSLAAAANAASLVGGTMPLRLIIVVDQLEEIFACPSRTAADRDAFAALLDAFARCGAIWVATTMRSDFFARVPEVEILAALAAGDGSFLLAWPRAAEIERMIQKPAEAAGIAFEVDPITGIGLDAELLEAAIKSPTALPLLEFTLDELYRQDISTHGGDFLTFATFHALGGLEGAVAARAEATVAALPENIAAALPRLVHSLVQVGDDNRIGARSAPTVELKASPEMTALTDALVAARLLIVADDLSATTVRVAHEALLRAWPRAAGLIAEDIDLLRARARAEQAMIRWRYEKESADFLLPHGRPLAEAAELLDARREELGADLVRYIGASAAADDARRQAELAAERARAEAEASAASERAQRATEKAAAAQRLTRRTRIAAIVLGALLVVAAGAGMYATLQRAQAERQRNAAMTSQSHFLADAASAAVDAGDARLARLLALAALPGDLLHPDRPYVASAEAALAQAWGEDRLITILPPPVTKSAPAPAALVPNANISRSSKRGALLMKTIGGNTLGFAFSGQGDRMVISGEGHARIYDLDSNVVLDVRHAGEKGAVALNGPGTQFAQGEGSGIRLWDVAAKSSRLLLGTGAADDAVLKVAFLPDGSRLIAGGAKGGVSIWSLPDSKLTAAVPGITGPTRDIRISSLGERAVVTGADGGAGLYDVRVGRLVALLSDAAQQTGDVDSRALRQGVGFLAKFSDDGALLATATDSTHVRLWKAATGTPIGGVMSHDNPVQSIAFTQGGERLAVSLLDGRTAIWASHPPDEARLVWPHGQAAQPTPNYNEILITDENGLHITDNAGRKLRTLLAGPGLTDGTCSPDGRWAAVTVNGTTVMLIPMAGGHAKIIYRANSGSRVVLTDFTPAAGRLVVFNQTGPAAMVDVANGKTIGPIGDGKQVIVIMRNSGKVAAISESGRTLIYGEDGTAQALATPPQFSITGLSGDGAAKLAASVGIGSATVFWALDSGKPVGKVDDNASLGATRVAFRAGPGGWIARGDVNQSILVWPWPDHGVPSIAGAPVKRLMGHTALISRMRVTADGRLLSEARDGTAILWDPLSGRRLAHYSGVSTTRLSDDGKRLVILDAMGAVRLARLPPSGQSLLASARARFGKLTDPERMRYFISESATK